MTALTVLNARVLTMTGGGPRRGAAMREVGVIERGFVQCEGERIVRVGSGAPERVQGDVIDAAGRVCVPAFRTATFSRRAAAS